MPAQTLDAFFRSLPKSAPATAYYFHGPEDLLKDEALRALLDRTLDPSLRDFNLDQRTAAQLDGDALFALCSSLPMMAERRVVVLREIEGIKRKPKLRAALLDYLARPAPDTVLVLIQGANEDAEDKEIAKAAVAVACDPLPEERVLKWLERRAKGLGVELPEDAALHLVRAVGGELAPLAAELQKLAALPAGEPLTVGAGGRAGRCPPRRDALRLARRGPGRRPGNRRPSARAAAGPDGQFRRQAGDDARYDDDRRRDRPRLLRPTACGGARWTRRCSTRSVGTVSTAC